LAPPHDDDVDQLLSAVDLADVILDDLEREPCRAPAPRNELTGLERRWK